MEAKIKVDLKVKNCKKGKRHDGSTTGYYKLSSIEESFFYIDFLRKVL